MEQKYRTPDITQVSTRCLQIYLENKITEIFPSKVAVSKKTKALALESPTDEKFKQILSQTQGSEQMAQSSDADLTAAQSLQDSLVTDELMQTFLAATAEMR